MKRLSTVCVAVFAAWMTSAVVAAPMATAGTDSATRSHPVNPTDQLEMTTTANCVLADKQCYFTAGANLRTPQGITGFPNDLWARQTTTIRSSNELNYLETQVVSPNPGTRTFKAMNQRVITTIFFGGGPPERYRISGTSQPTHWATGQPMLDADYIVCAQIQVVYAGVNITSPQTCSQTTFS